jgi:hypothetical protein
MNTNHNFSTEVVAGQNAGIIADPFKEFGSEAMPCAFTRHPDLIPLKGPILSKRLRRSAGRP